MEALWDSRTYGESEIESPAWHENMLVVRKQKIEEGKAEYLTIEELRSKR